jgi:hypothetical protein
MDGLQFFVHNDSDAVRVELAGSLRGADVETVHQAWQMAALTDGLKPVIVDITFITDTDECGRALLVVMRRFGARIVAQSPESSAIAQPIVTKAIKIAGSMPRWFHRLMTFLLEERPARHASTEYTGPDRSRGDVFRSLA